MIPDKFKLNGNVALVTGADMVAVASFDGPQYAKEGAMAKVSVSDTARPVTIDAVQVFAVPGSPPGIRWSA